MKSFQGRTPFSIRTLKTGGLEVEALDGLSGAGGDHTSNYQGMSQTEIKKLMDSRIASLRSAIGAELSPKQISSRQVKLSHLVEYVQNSILPFGSGEGLLQATKAANALLARSIPQFKPVARQYMEVGIPQFRPDKRFGSTLAGLGSTCAYEPVQRLQRLLNQQLGITLAVDGIVGPQTMSALQETERQKGMSISTTPNSTILSALGFGSGDIANIRASYDCYRGGGTSTGGGGATGGGGELPLPLPEGAGGGTNMTAILLAAGVGLLVVGGYYLYSSSQKKTPGNGSNGSK